MATHCRDSQDTQMAREKLLIWPAVWHLGSCWWLWWLWCHLWKGPNQSGCLQLQHWTAGWWRRMACRPPVVRCPLLWCVGDPRQPYSGCAGRCSRGRTTGPGTCLHLAHPRQHALLSGCWRWSAVDLHTNTHAKDTQARREERWTDTPKYRHTHTHTSGHIRAYIHTQVCLSVTQSTTPKPWWEDGTD